MTFDGKAFGAAIVDEVKSFVSSELKPLWSAIENLEKQIRSLPEPKEAKDIDVDQIIDQVVLRFGSDVDVLKTQIQQVADSLQSIDDIKSSVSDLVDSAVKSLPAPKDGDSVTLDDVAPLISAEVEKRVSELPKPKDGDKGRDGLDVKDLFRADGGRLIAVMSDGTTKDLGLFVGKDGENGKDGADGLGFDDLDLIEDDAGLHLKFSQGDRVKTFPLPVVLDKGVYREGRAYLKGSGVTWGGQYWIAKCDTSEKPSAGDAWRMAVRKGRDGKAGA